MFYGGDVEMILTVPEDSVGSRETHQGRQGRNWTEKRQKSSAGGPWKPENPTGKRQPYGADLHLKSSAAFYAGNVIFLPSLKSIIYKAPERKNDRFFLTESPEMRENKRYLLKLVVDVAPETAEKRRRGSRCGKLYIPVPLDVREKKSDPEKRDGEN